MTWRSFTTENKEIVARISSAGRRGATLLFSDGKTADAKVSSNVFRTTGNPVCGDRVRLRKTGEAWYVDEILERTGTLERTSPLGKKQLLAANIDLVLVVASIASPPLRRGFIDRALASAEYSRLKAALVLNKTDLARREDAADTEELQRVYGGMAGYRVFETSTKTGRGIREFREAIHGKTVVLYGVSAAGKTSLIKAVNPNLDLDLKVGAVNEKTTKGRHTTVSSRLIRLEEGTYLMDTPGLRAFSVDHIPTKELRYCFREFLEMQPCRFRDCLHETEPGCSIQAAVENGSIDRERYLSYLKLLREEN
ncbi:MAG TPA: ribosome small subunit-dependent GTPase A [Candidatus Sabulitectum sp.]|nr:ribosome small subunit-dependent GTPase A [Candidatus Sabulitectum sp.]HPF32454.1 ribosome small subunit-dependent GTPase A [Candidatus Sabulitectum sp.]HPJ27638.1 ribosome small subunit-dependent GTPase A [Candidatus Sabulitectum sp.]HPR21386.1 ribosome small subunit-dependent GTPase A [Candidatus Sabulitectum sp.]HRW77905.1 ribosome small subunit-dependent GTPase A [Candidatus Sabulitectum sp.]